MKTIIVGASFTGIQLAKTLVAEGNDIVLIDNDTEKVRLAQSRIDCTVVQADGNSLAVLEKDAGIADADVLVMLTEDDETNMITCSLVDAVYPNVMKIARVRNDAYYLGSRVKGEGSRDKGLGPRVEGLGSRVEGPGLRCDGVRPPFGIDTMLHPDIEAADAIGRALSHGVVGNVVALEGRYGIATLKLDETSPLVGLQLKDISTIPNWTGLVAYIENADGAVLPSGDTRLAVGDNIGLLASSAEMQGLLKFVAGAPLASPRRLAVFGAGRIGSHVVAGHLAAHEPASFLSSVFGRTEKGCEVVLVDSSERLCREATERFKGIRVLCGDITDADFISEEGLADCDVMVAASGMYERNLVAAAYLKSRGVKKTIALTESSEFNDVAERLGIDVAVPMRGTVVDAIMSHLRGPNVTSIHTVCSRRLEIVACDVSPGSRVVGKKLSEIPLRGECIVLLARHADSPSFEVAHGASVINANDRIVFVMHSGDKRFIRLFGDTPTP